MSDAAYIIMKSLQGKIEYPRYYDVLHPQPVEKQKTGAEIADDIIKRHGLKVVD